MGLFDRIRVLFKANSPQEDHPLQVLSAFIESSSEKLRELTVSVNRSESEWLLQKRKMDLHLVNSAMYRDKADQEAKVGNADMAKHWLVQAHSQESYLAKLEPEVERLQQSTDQMKETLAQIENKLQTAKELRQQFMLRINAADSQVQMNTALNEILSSSALDRVREETFLAEAKAELMQSRPK
ncbi:PspA/IM30 family protein [Paenibacillus sp. MMO-177]|uniref:PspA/IM30 family protein n=1 Tax=Paenibacillus sp. MMO-177 TaxID=3081289 RepID=UPI00301985C2